MKVKKERTNIKLKAYAKEASATAKRVSSALDISYDIIENGTIYNVKNNAKVEILKIKKVISENSDLKKGSIICLSPED